MDGLRRVVDLLCSLDLDDRRKVAGLNPERADIIVAGALVVEELVRASGYPELTVCTFGVRDGYLIRRTFPDSWPLHGPAPVFAEAMAAAGSGARRCA
jgi:exopolyphosphatase/pppGpp-phosphohydrolase